MAAHIRRALSFKSGVGMGEVQVPSKGVARLDQYAGDLRCGCK